MLHVGQEVLAVIGDCPVTAVVRGLPKPDRPQQYRVEVRSADARNRWHNITIGDIIVTDGEESEA